MGGSCGKDQVRHNESIVQTFPAKDRAQPLAPPPAKPAPQKSAALSVRGAIPGISSTGGTLVRGYTRKRQQLADESSQPPIPHERVTGDMDCQVKLVVVGDQSYGGKGHLLSGLANSYGSFRLRDPDPSPGYRPTAAANGDCQYNVTTTDGDYLELTATLWDTSGQESLCNLRRSAYPGADIVLYVCWDHQSLTNVLEMWEPEVEENCVGAYDIDMVTQDAAFRFCDSRLWDMERDFDGSSGAFNLSCRRDLAGEVKLWEKHQRMTFSLDLHAALSKGTNANLGPPSLAHQWIDRRLAGCLQSSVVRMFLKGTLDPTSSLRALRDMPRAREQIINLVAGTTALTEQVRIVTEARQTEDLWRCKSAASRKVDKNWTSKDVKKAQEKLRDWRALHQELWGQDHLQMIESGPEISLPRDWYVRARRYVTKEPLLDAPFSILVGIPPDEDDEDALNQNSLSSAELMAGAEQLNAIAYVQVKDDARALVAAIVYAWRENDYGVGIRRGHAQEYVDHPDYASTVDDQ